MSIYDATWRASADRAVDVIRLVPDEGVTIAEAWTETRRWAPLVPSRFAIPVSS